MDALLPIVELQYVDETGTKGSTTVKYPQGTPVAVMDADATALASLIAPLTGCVLIRQRIIYKAVTNPRDVPDMGSTVKSQGVFFFSTGDGNPMELIGVPGIDSDTLIETGTGAGVLIDTENEDIAAFIEEVLESGLTNPFGDTTEAFVTAYRQSRS